MGKIRDRLVSGMYCYIEDIVTKAIQGNKRLIIWGCGKGGSFLRHLIIDIDGRLDISYFIDEHIVLPCGCEKLKIFRSSLLRYLPQGEYVVLLSIRKDEHVENMLEELGYEKNKDYYDVRGEIGGSYLEYLEKQDSSIDFSYVTKEDRPDLYCGEYFESKPFDHSSIDDVFMEISNLPCEKNFFDIGCGKGQILLMAAMDDLKRIGGIEFNAEIAEISRTNMKRLQISADIVIEDATIYEGFDDYSIFFLYNPFGEESIKKVVSHIKDSIRRSPRSAFLVYGNPFFHRSVMEIGGVTLYKQVIVDLYDPLLNIYQIGDQL